MQLCSRLSIPCAHRAPAPVGADRLSDCLLCVACRALYLIMLFTPASLAAPFAVGLGLQRQRWLDLVVWTLERAGPAFIKWGQWAATRPDLFPPDLCTKLAQLQTGAPTHPFAYTRQAVEDAFG